MSSALVVSPSLSRYTVFVQSQGRDEDVKNRQAGAQERGEGKGKGMDTVYISVMLARRWHRGEVFKVGWEAVFNMFSVSVQGDK
jgi:hypothetical protein